jgi:hypothetical protein
MRYQGPYSNRTLWPGCTSKKQALEWQHKWEVRTRIELGKPVATHVLAEYPDLWEQAHPAGDKEITLIVRIEYPPQFRSGKGETWKSITSDDKFMSGLSEDIRRELMFQGLGVDGISVRIEGEEV